MEAGEGDICTSCIPSLSSSILEEGGVLLPCRSLYGSEICSTSIGSSFEMAGWGRGMSGVGVGVGIDVTAFSLIIPPFFRSPLSLVAVQAVMKVLAG